MFAHFLESEAIDRDQLLRAYSTARRDLLGAREPSGHWVGKLSGSSLSTATAVSALAVVDRCAESQQFTRLVERGLDYLVRQQNPDGGWGDTDKSLSNIATTMLARAAFHLAGRAAQHVERLARAENYIERQGGLTGLRRRYGEDKTFAVPILSNCAIAGLVPWREVAPLPFELACLPHRMLGWVRLPVVSYAIPALVAIGQARYFHRRPRNPLVRVLRRLSISKSLDVLQRMQPESGGFLEATPLTSFVVMNLAASGRAEHPVVRRGIAFLRSSVREDGSWPIDTNLATWVTTLSIKALSGSGDPVPTEPLDWLLGCQHQQVHAFTNAVPGGWAWTDLSGGVPDGDDTAGALLALAVLRKVASREQTERIDAAAEAGIDWLLGLQNADGGWPTFCRGWGALPFDRSGVDLTAHALRALQAWRRLDDRANATDAAIRRGLDFLARKQRADGSWVPLWFGNQYQAAEENPVYGTARALLAYRDLHLLDSEPARRGVAWLLASQRPDGGWGDAAGASGARLGQVSSVEETAVALETLLSAGLDPSAQPRVDKALNWLVAAVESGRYRESAPIGFYFAKLWYYEELYPLIFTVAALGQAVCRLLPGLDRERSRPG